MTRQPPQVYIEHLANVIYAYTEGCRERHGITHDAASLVAQDLAPLLGYFLHTRGVDVDWADGSFQEHQTMSPGYAFPPRGFDWPELADLDAGFHRRFAEWWP